jgi:hypothetical protein
VDRRGAQPPNNLPIPRILPYENAEDDPRRWPLPLQSTFISHGEVDWPDHSDSVIAPKAAYVLSHDLTKNMLQHRIFWIYAFSNRSRCDCAADEMKALIMQTVASNGGITDNQQRDENI